MSYSPSISPGGAVHKTADQPIADDVLADDTALFINLSAATKYYFKFVLFQNSDSATAGIKVALTGTAGINSLKAQVYIFDETTGAIVELGRITAFDAAVGSALSTGANPLIIEGSIDVSTAGTLKLKWAQNATDAANPTTIQRNSSLVTGPGPAGATGPAGPAGPGPQGTWTMLGFGAGVALPAAPGGQVVLLSGAVLATNETPLLLVSLKTTPGATVGASEHSQSPKVAGQSGVFWWTEEVQDPADPARSLCDFFVENFQVDATVDWVAYKVLNS